MQSISPGLYQRVITLPLNKPSNRQLKTSKKYTSRPAKKNLDNAKKSTTKSFFNNLVKLMDQITSDDTTQNHAANVIIRKRQTHSDLSQYLHVSCLSPPASTFATAIKKKHVTSWTGLSVDLINRHRPKIIFTSQGHLS